MVLNAKIKCKIKCKKPMNRAQRVHKKNSVICLVMFTPGVMVIKMSKMAHFLYFLLITVFFFADSVVFLLLLPSKGYLTPKHINHTIFWKKSIIPFRCTYILPKMWLIFCCHQQIIQKSAIFWHFYDCNSQSKHNTYTNDP